MIRLSKPQRKRISDVDAKVLALCAALGLELSATARRARPTLQELREEQRGGKTHA